MLTRVDEFVGMLDMVRYVWLIRQHERSQMYHILFVLDYLHILSLTSVRYVMIPPR